MRGVATRLGTLASAAGVPWLVRALVAGAIAVAFATLAWQGAQLDADAQRARVLSDALDLVTRQHMLAEEASALATQLALVPAQDRTTALSAQLVADLAQTVRRLDDGGRGVADAAASLALPVKPAPLLAALVAAASGVSGPADARALAAAAAAYAQATEALATGLRAHTQDVLGDRTFGYWWQLAYVAAFATVIALVAGEWLARHIARLHARTRRQTEELERLALVASVTDNAVILTDDRGRLRWANEAFMRLSGYTVEEATGHTPGSLLQFEGTDPATQARLRDAIAAGEAVQVEILNRAKGGRVYWLRLDIQPLRDASGRLTGFVGVETDITPLVIEQQRLSSLLQALPTGVVQQDVDGRIVEANDEACRVLGLSRDQLRGRASVDPRWHAIHEDGSPLPGEQHPAMVALRSGHAVFGVTMGVALPSGERRWLRVNAQPLRAPDGRPSGVVSCFLDVSAYVAHRRLIASTIDAAQLGLWQCHLRRESVWTNAAWWTMLGREPASGTVDQRQFRELVHPQDLAQVDAAVQAHLTDPSRPFSAEFRLRHRDGHWVWVLSCGAIVDTAIDGTPLAMAGVHLDVSARKALEQQLAHDASTDALTGLANRRALMHRLARCAERAQRDPDYRYAVLLLDLDRFKQINDSLGHDTGDELLCTIASRLHEVLRVGDSVARFGDEAVAARLGGDEFTVVLEPLRACEHAQIVAQRLLETLRKPFDLRGRQVVTDASIGVVCCDARRDCSAEAVLRDADTAMYEAKRSGRARVVTFTHDMHERAQNAQSLTDDLRTALQRDGEVFAVFQPIVDLNTGAVCGAEALARWQHPQRGAVSPAEFVPVAEDSGLIAELGTLMLRHACREAAGWRRALGDRAPATVSVNVSRLQFQHGDLAATVSSILHDTGLPASALRLEITESVAMQEMQMLRTLDDLRRLGVGIALDDFGTGYSSLSTLDQLPLDAIKIDRGFVQRMVDSPYQTALVDATLRVAAALRLDVTAEGVETAEQAQLLRRCGCAKAQGWLFGKPQTADAFASWLLECAGPPGPLERAGPPDAERTHDDAPAAADA